MGELSGTAELGFVVVGAQRGGSTELSAGLQDHPDIYMCPDEVPYFEDPFFARSSPSTLIEVFGRARPGQLLGIHCPSYLARAEVAERIKAHSPDARILAILRDPVARAVSGYFWYMQFGKLPLEPLDVGITRLLDGCADPAYPQAGEVLDWSRYGRDVSRYVELFGTKRVLVLLSGELEAPVTFERAYRFLGVDPGHEPRFRQHRRNAGVYDLHRIRFLRARRRFAWVWANTKTYSYRPRRLRRPLRFVPNAAIVAVDRLVLSRFFGNPSPQLPPDLEARLRAFYADDVRLLESLLGLDLSAWREPQVSLDSTPSA